MPRRLQRKLVDFTSAEDLAQLQEALTAQRIPNEFHILARTRRFELAGNSRARREFDVFRVLVPLKYLEDAKKVYEAKKVRQ